MSFSHSYYPNYFELDDILASNEKISCKFNIDLPKLGYLNPSSETNDLKAGVKLELPFWLADSLRQYRSTIFSPEIPRIYKEAYKEILAAEACAVDLYKLNIYYFEHGNNVSKFPDHRDVSDILIETFKSRFRLVMDLAQNAGPDPSMVDKLDRLERRLFTSSHSAQIRLNDWLVESGVRLSAASMVVNHKKRKRTDLDYV